MPPLLLLLVWWLWPVQPRLQTGAAADLLQDQDPALRAAACDRLGHSQDASRLAELVARASDSDWRVRAAAFTALDRFLPFAEPLPHRDTPLQAREATLLRWLVRHDSSADSPLRPRLCDLYAGKRHVEFGATIAQECLRCHAGPDPPASAAATSCASCHPGVDAQWSASSHAQSLSHLRIRTVDPRTRQVQPYDFGPLRGISCAACHDVHEGGAHPSACPVSSRPRADSCIACHAQTQQQWRSWLAGPQPRRAQWPPGALEFSSGDRRDCLDCHMTAPASHRLTARRDPDLLRSGLHIELRPGESSAEQRIVHLVVTNLAGHDYPTGSSHRAVTIHGEFGPAEDEAVLLATFSPRGASTALRPGESRTIKVALPEGADWVRCSAVYIRNQFDSQAVRIPITSVELTLPATR